MKQIYKLDHTVPKLTVFIENVGNGIYRQTYIVEHGYMDHADRFERSLTKREVDALVVRMLENGWVDISHESAE